MDKLLKTRWIRRTLAVLAAALVLAMLTHPELRLLAPIFDALGIDGLLLLLSAPILAALQALPWRSWLAQGVWPFLAGAAFIILACEHWRAQLQQIRRRAPPR